MEGRAVGDRGVLNYILILISFILYNFFINSHVSWFLYNPGTKSLLSSYVGGGLLNL